MVETFASDLESGVLKSVHPPCLSLYQPTHRSRPDNQQDRIRFRNLVKTLEESLMHRHEAGETRDLLKPFQDLGHDRDFWENTGDGLAVLGARDFFRVYKLHQTVDELALVARSFHLKPLLSALQACDHFHLLGVNRHEVKLFLCGRDRLEEVELARGVPRTLTMALGDELTEPHLTVASYGGTAEGQGAMHHGHGGRKPEVDKDAERFFRLVDRGITTHHSRPSRLPLVLSGLAQHHHLFRRVSKNPFLVDAALDIHPDAAASAEDLHRRAWAVMEPRFSKRVTDAVSDFESCKAKGLGHDDLDRVAEAVALGRVSTLMIEERRQIPGSVDASTGQVTRERLADPEVDDVLDDLGELVLRRGGRLLVVKADEMPSPTGVAAIFRS